MADEPTEHYVKINRQGRWLYEVNVMRPISIELPGSATWRTITMTSESPWLAFGRRHAEWLGARKLRKHIRREAWRAS